MGLIDSHAHLTDENLAGDVAGVLARGRAAGVKHVITIAQNAADTVAAIEVARRHPEVSATAGVHPHEAAGVEAEDWERLAAAWRDPLVVACGEIGLDYHYEFSDRATQRKVFARQLEMVAATSLPLVVHCREAFDDTIAVLREAGYEGRAAVFHCFSATETEARRLAEHGWRASFTGVVTYKSARQVQAVAREYPAEDLMLETDCPYLSPVPVRGKFPNEPAYLVHTASFVAGLRGEALEDLSRSTTANVRSFFRLP